MGESDVFMVMSLLIKSLSILIPPPWTLLKGQLKASSEVLGVFPFNFVTFTCLLRLSLLSGSPGFGLSV